jgi:undecaprenyl-diphosphatase
MNQRASATRKGQRAAWRAARAIWHGSVGRWAQREFAILATLALAAAAIWGFAELADDVLEGETHAFDERILFALRSASDLSDPRGPGWLEELMRDITGLGGIGILSFITLAVAGFLALDRKTHAALFVVVAVSSGMLLSTALKMGFDRPRPDLVPHGALVYTASFPSGHATVSAVAYLTLGALLARVQARRVLKLYVLGLAILLTVAVGASRVYLGVHWPTDVLAGWAIGAAWALCCWAAALWLQRRGQVESPGPDPGAALPEPADD